MRAASRSRLACIIALLWAAGVLLIYFAPAVRVALTAGVPLQVHGSWRLPYLRDAIASAITALTGAAVLVAAALAVGRAVSRAAGWRFSSLAEAIPIAASIGIAVFAYVGLALAAAGAYRPAVLRALAAAPLLVLAVRALGAPPRLGAGAREMLRLPADRRSRAWMWIAAAAVACALLAALAPEWEYDAVWYHLGFPHRFLQRGTLVDLPAEYVSLYPMTWELWFGYGLAVGGQIAAKLLHFACLPLTGCVVYAATRRWAAGARPWAAVALFVTIPTVIWEGSTAYVDLALALHVSLVAYALALYVSERRGQWFAIAGVELGMALATKHLALFVAAIAGVALLIALLLRERRLGAALRPALALAAIAVLFPLPWYARSWLATHNPVFPELYHLFGGPADRWNELADRGLAKFMAHFGRPRTVRNELALPWDVTMHGARYDGTLGPIFLVLAPGLLVLRRRRTLAVLAACTLAFVALWATPIASFQFRWLVPVLPLVAVLGAAALTRMAAIARLVAGRRAARALVAVAMVVAVLDLPFFTPLQQRDTGAPVWWLNHTLYGIPLAVVVGAQSRDDYLARHVPTYRAWQFANAKLPARARLLTWSGGDQLYGERDRIGVFAPPVRDAAFAPAGDTSSAFSTLRLLGITHLLIDKRFLATNGDPNGAWNDYALTDSAVLASRFERVYEDERAVIYRMR